MPSSGLRGSPFAACHYKGPCQPTFGINTVHSSMSLQALIHAHRDA